MSCTTMLLIMQPSAASVVRRSRRSDGDGSTSRPSGTPRGSRRAVLGGTDRRMTLSSISGVKGKALAMAPSMTTLAALTVPALAASALASTARTFGHASAMRSSMPSGYSTAPDETVLGFTRAAL